jgi:hypothetical protein
LRGSALNLTRQFSNALRGMPCASQYSRGFKLLSSTPHDARAKKARADAPMIDTRPASRSLLIAHRRREQIASTSRKQGCAKWTATTVLSKIPDPLQNFAVTQNIFAVKWRREFAKDRCRAVAFGDEFKGNRLNHALSL